MNEKILCAAVWYKDIPLKKLNIPDTNPVNVDKGVVFCGYRHCHCMHTMTAVTGLRSVQFAEDAAGDFEEGFLTSKNRFVDRVEGLEIALREGQVLDLDDVRGNELYSEDLYRL